MHHTLPSLPYSYAALEPFFDAATMEIHHTKHHQTYVDKLNAALVPHPDLQTKTLDDLLKQINLIPETLRPAVINHGGGHHNHSLFWTSLTPKAPATPNGPLLDALNATFTSFSSFKQQFSEAAAGHFGSGWAWLVSKPKLSIITLPNQNSPLIEGYIPLLGLDLWEHAYYLKYQNRRADYIEAWWHLINWPEVETRYQK